MSPLVVSKAMMLDVFPVWSQSRITMLPKTIGLAPSATSNANFSKSRRHNIFPSNSSAAITAEPNTTNTRLPSLHGVGAP